MRFNLYKQLSWYHSNMYIAAKIYNLMLLNRIRPEVDKKLRKNQNGFRTNRSTTGQILTVRRIIGGANEKNLTATLLFLLISPKLSIPHIEERWQRFLKHMEYLKRS